MNINKQLKLHNKTTFRKEIDFLSKAPPSFALKGRLISPNVEVNLYLQQKPHWMPRLIYYFLLDKLITIEHRIKGYKNAKTN